MHTPYLLREKFDLNILKNSKHGFFSFIFLPLFDNSVEIDRKHREKGRCMTCKKGCMHLNHQIGARFPLSLHTFPAFILSLANRLLAEAT